MDFGTSFTSKIFRKKFMLFFGRISLSLYLLHAPLTGYVTIVMKKQQLVTSNNRNGNLEIEENYEHWYELCADLPLWSPLIIILLSYVVAYIATKYFAEPIARILNNKNTSNNKCVNIRDRPYIHMYF